MGKLRRVAVGAVVAGAMALLVALGGEATKSATAVADEPAASYLQLRINPSFHPYALPRRERTPVGLTLSTRFRDPSGATPSRLSTLAFRLDRDYALDFSSLSSCKRRYLNWDTRHARAGCPTAIAGHGEIEFETEYAQWTPMQIDSELTLFRKGTQDGTTTFFLHAFIPVVLEEAVVSTVKVSRPRSEKYGTEMRVSVPEFAEGHIAITGLHLTLPRQLRHREGEFAHPVSLRCRQPEVHVSAEGRFRDGFETVVERTKRCHVQPRSR